MRIHRVITTLLLMCLYPALLLAQAKPIAAGTEIKVRMIDSLNSGTAKVGDLFHATLEQAVMQDGKQLYPKNADVTGTVAAVHASGRLTDPGSLSLVLNTITSGNSAASINVQPLEVRGESHGKSNAEKIGGGAALGAVLGGIFGGGKGAAIGAGAGGAAGTAGAAATGKKEAKVDSEAILTFTASSEATPPASTATTSESKPAEEKSAPPAEQTEEEPKAGSSSTEKATASSFANAVLFTARDRRVSATALMSTPLNSRRAHWKKKSCLPDPSAMCAWVGCCRVTCRRKRSLCRFHARNNCQSCPTIRSGLSIPAEFYYLTDMGAFWTCSTCKRVIESATSRKIINSRFCP